MDNLASLNYICKKKTLRTILTVFFTVELKLFSLFEEFKLMFEYHQQFQVILMIICFSVLTMLYFGFYKAPENED